MGIFSWLKKAKDDVIEMPVINNTGQVELISPEIKKEKISINKLGTVADRLQYIKDNCEIINEGERLIHDAKIEYEAVTSYLQDMQIIDRIPGESRDGLEDAARKIINLTKERNRLRQRTSTLSDQQYRLFERYESQIPRELPSIRDAEKYQKLIEQDMTNLQMEKKNLIREDGEVQSKQSMLKGITVTTAIILVILFGIFAALSLYTEGDYTIPFLLTILMGMVIALYIVIEARKNIVQINLIQSKQNRQIMIMNKVKIKAVNNRNYLDYTYGKYNINGFSQLKSMWEEYVRMKDDAHRYQQNTELLEFYNQELVDGLIEFDIKDSEVWIYQPTAIIDQREMVEIRHRLNGRRQNLREQIQLNETQIEDGKKAIQSTIIKYPESNNDIHGLLKQYRISI